MSLDVVEQHAPALLRVTDIERDLAAGTPAIEYLSQGSIGSILVSQVMHDDFVSPRSQTSGYGGADSLAGAGYKH
jgi:hypothetical protein